MKHLGKDMEDIIIFVVLFFSTIIFIGCAFCTFALSMSFTQDFTQEKQEKQKKGEKKDVNDINFFQAVQNISTSSLDFFDGSHIEDLFEDLDKVSNEVRDLKARLAEKEDVLTKITSKIKKETNDQPFLLRIKSNIFFCAFSGHLLKKKLVVKRKKLSDKGIAEFVSNGYAPSSKRNISSQNID